MAPHLVNSVGLHRSQRVVSGTVCAIQMSRRLSSPLCLSLTCKEHHLYSPLEWTANPLAPSFTQKPNNAVCAPPPVLGPLVCELVLLLSVHVANKENW